MGHGQGVLARIGAPEPTRCTRAVNARLKQPVAQPYRGLEDHSRRQLLANAAMAAWSPHTRPLARPFQGAGISKSTSTAIRRALHWRLSSTHESTLGFMAVAHSRQRQEERCARTCRARLERMEINPRPGHGSEREHRQSWQGYRGRVCGGRQSGKGEIRRQRIRRDVHARRRSPRDCPPVVASQVGQTRRRLLRAHPLPDESLSLGVPMQTVTRPRSDDVAQRQDPRPLRLFGPRHQVSEFGSVLMTPNQPLRSSPLMLGTSNPRWWITFIKVARGARPFSCALFLSTTVVFIVVMMMAATATTNSAFAIPGRFTVVPMTKFEPSRMTKAVRIGDLSPDENPSFFRMEVGNIGLRQSRSAGWEARLCRQNYFGPKRQVLKFAQILIVRPADADGATKTFSQANFRH
jgi:hypothetical protein